MEVLFVCVCACVRVRACVRACVRGWRYRVCRVELAQFSIADERPLGLGLGLGVRFRVRVRDRV